MSEHTPVVSIEPYADIRMTYRPSRELRNFMGFRGVPLGDTDVYSYSRRRVTNYNTLADLESTVDRYRNLALSVGAYAVVGQVGVLDTPDTSDLQRIFFGSDHESKLFPTLIDQYEQIPSKEIEEVSPENLLVRPLCYVDLPSQGVTMYDKILGNQETAGIAAGVGNHAKAGGDTLCLRVTGIDARYGRNVKIGNSDLSTKFANTFARD